MAQRRYVFPAQEFSTAISLRSPSESNQSREAAGGHRSGSIGAHASPVAQPPFADFAERR